MSRRRRRENAQANPDDMTSPRNEEAPVRRVYSVNVDRDGWVLTIADIPADVIARHTVETSAADLRELTLARMLRHIDRRDMGLE